MRRLSKTKDFMIDSVRHQTYLRHLTKRALLTDASYGLMLDGYGQDSRRLASAVFDQLVDDGVLKYWKSGKVTYISPENRTTPATDAGVEK